MSKIQNGSVPLTLTAYTEREVYGGGKTLDDIKIRLVGLASPVKNSTDVHLVRFAIANEYMKAHDCASAVEHLARAVALDPDYTAAWKIYGKALAEAGRSEDAVRTYEQGIAVAQRKGDRQAEKEMQVFLRRLRNRAQPPEG